MTGLQSALTGVVLALGVWHGATVQADDVVVGGTPGVRLYYENGARLAYTPLCVVPCRVQLAPSTYRFHAEDVDGTAFPSLSATQVSGAGMLDVTLARRRASRGFGFVLLGAMPAVASVAWIPFTSLDGQADVGKIVAVEFACVGSTVLGAVLVLKRPRLVVRFSPLLPGG